MYYLENRKFKFQIPKKMLLLKQDQLDYKEPTQHCEGIIPIV